MMCRPVKLMMKFYRFGQILFIFLCSTSSAVVLTRQNICIRQIFFIFLCSTSSVVTLTGDKVCHRGNETFCCKDYEERNNICVECRPGFRGFDCNLTCPENHYGPRCNMPCNCNNISEYCHPVCGCISNLTKPLMIDNVTNTEHYVNITDLEQTISVESCLSSINKSMETTDKSIETKNNNFGKPADERPSIKDHTILIVFLVVMPSVLSACLLLFFGITYRKCYTRKKEEGHDGVHNELYITQEGNSENNPVSREDTSEDPLYGFCQYDDDEAMQGVQ